MAAMKIRLMLSVSDDIAKRAEALKKEVYFNKPYAEMYRQLIQLGLDALKTEQFRKPPAGHST